MLTRLSLVALVALMVAPMSACDSTEEVASEPVTLSPDDVVSELDAEGLLLFCEHARAGLTEVSVVSSDPEPMCIGQGLAARFGGDGEVSTCEAARDACLEEMSETPDAFAPMSCSDEGSVEGGFGDCAITVAEFDACTDAVLASMEELRADLRCDISNEEAMALEGSTADVSPAECTAVEAACPMLFVDLPETH